MHGLTEASTLRKTHFKLKTMRPNRLRELLDADLPSLGTHILSTWPSVSAPPPHPPQAHRLSTNAPMPLRVTVKSTRAAALPGRFSVHGAKRMHADPLFRCAGHRARR